MSISGVGNASSLEQFVASTRASEKERNVGEMGKDQFIQLLITQLRYQDPMNPTQDKEFIGQMAQFTALEQMQNLNASFNSVKGASLLGKEIVGTVTQKNSNESTEVYGLVTSVKMIAGETYAVVNGVDVPVSKISEISEPGANAV
jgi:flagellar basal-body rod modification protein FlgD